MTLKIKWLSTLIILILFILPVRSQTPNDSWLKYERLDDGSYLVNSDVTLTILLGCEGEVCQMRVEPRKSPVSGGAPAQVMPSKVVADILAELMPASRRGKRLGVMAVNAGCLVSPVEVYERAVISSSVRCEEQGGGVYYVTVEVRGACCPKQRPSKPPV